MPGHTRLERSPPKLAAHKALPRKHAVVGDLYPAAKPVRMPSSTDDDSVASPKLSIRTSSPLVSPVALDADSAFPPTPPSASRDAPSGTGFSPPRQPPPQMAPLSPKRSGLSTPTTGRSPPTPDNTPPSDRYLRKPAPSPLASLSASRAESFQTAREEQWSSDDDQLDRHARVGAFKASTRAYADATRALRYGERGLGFEFEREDGDLTPTRELHRKLHQRIQPPKLNGQGRHLETGSVKKSDAPSNDPAFSFPDGNPSRNVTLHQDKRPQTPDQQPETTHARETAQESPVLPSKFHESPRSVSNPAPALPIETAKNRAVSDSGAMLDRGVHSRDPKRLSDVSTTSTVVEAVIRVTTPPHAKRMLRHVNKYTGLRSLSGSSIDISKLSPTSVERTHDLSIRTHDTQSQKLAHKRASIGTKRDRDSLDRDVEGPAVPVLKRPLRHSRDYSHVSAIHTPEAPIVGLNDFVQLRPSTASSTASTVPPIDTSPHKLRKVGELDTSPRVSQLTGTTVDDLAKDATSQPSSPNSARRVLEGGS
ncbi:MAG: hypothetical protein INR71_12980, partial [Terriglobus roseus]|nr:hypothetical protein [Terriglobus roseus]